MKILVLSPHTDDAELGCGGTIIKLLEMGNQILWVAFSTAEDSLPAGLPKDTLKREFFNVLDELDLNEDCRKVFDFKVRNLNDYRQQILDDLIKIRREYTPDLVIGPSLNDLHQDHHVVAHEMVRAFKTTSSIICYELPWNHVSFNTQCFTKLDLRHMEKKYDLLKNYQSQFIKKKTYFSRDFIFGLAKTRGVQCDSEYAEAFEVIRWML